MVIMQNGVVVGGLFDFLRIGTLCLLAVYPCVSVTEFVGDLIKSCHFIILKKVGRILILNKMQFGMV